MRTSAYKCRIVSSIAWLSCAAGIASAADSLREQFASPPATARPHTWWHWIDGNISKEGITADLEAMKAAGIGGAHIFNAGGFGGGRAVMPKGPFGYNTPEWRKMMVHAMAEAQRLGLEITIHNCCGWSSSGGPWVKPEDAMKKVVWSTAEVQGPAPCEVELPVPPTNHGFYRDIAVFAMPETKIPAKPDGRQANLTGMGGNDGNPFGELKWPVVQPKDVLDISSNLKDGRLSWTPPAGHWTLLRLGYTLTGTMNVASSDSGRGLEVDKLSTECLDRFLDVGVLPLIKEAGPLAGDSLTTVLIDSYETGEQNWTAGMADEFSRRRGYDLRPYLPALAGVAIEKPETTLRFLHDFRRTIEEMWADNYCGHFAKRLKEYRLSLAVEPYGNGTFNAFSYSDSAQLIMGEYWVGEGSIGSSVRLAASIAHVLGRPIVGAEALTAVPDRAGWKNHPWEWKPFADRGYTNGINRIIYHRFTHQPWPAHILPGMTMGPWGSHVDRTQTWWPMALSWNEYLARCQYLLQAGRFVADVCLYTGENAPQAYREQMHGLAQVPRGYDYDVCGAPQVMQASVKDGRVVLASGMSYRVLALPAADDMSPAMARKIRDLAAAGATVVGPRPRRALGLQDAGKGDAEVAALLKEAKVIVDRPLDAVLGDLKLPPDFRCEAPNVSAIHRRIGAVDAYFVAWFGRSVAEHTCFFRSEGRRPELWHPETGQVEAAPIWRAVPGGVEVVLRFEPAGSVFVVFAEQAAGADSIAGVKADVRSEPKVAGPRIVKAEYGVLNDPSKTRDVTQLVADAVAGGGEVRAENDALGGDPAYMVVKALRVTHVDGGRERTVTIPEHEVFVAGAALPTPPPIWQVWTEAGRANLLAWQSGKYVVTTASGARKEIAAEVPLPVAVAGPWEVRFPAGWDAPETATFDKLISWTDHAAFGIRYFSGTVTYTKTLTVPADLLGAGRRLILDLGVVREVAQVRLNGKDLPVMWWPPFRADVTGLVKAGANALEVRVTNLWVNRLVGDEQLPDDIGWQGETMSKWPEWLIRGTPRPEPRRKTFTTWHHNTKDTPLLPSGLLGPVMLRPAKVCPAW
ncbi:MAG TPA: glycosyl hydrolase [Phycisphaerae bacterium]|nr:glycosyl hydrolase [Phycisphaerae bacterium]